MNNLFLSRVILKKPEVFKGQGYWSTKMGAKSHNHFTNIQQCVGPIINNGIVSTITVSESIIDKIQGVQNSFIRLALRLPKCMSAHLGKYIPNLIHAVSTMQLWYKRGKTFYQSGRVPLKGNFLLQGAKRSFLMVFPLKLECQIKNRQQLMTKQLES